MEDAWARSPPTKPFSCFRLLLPDLITATSSHPGCFAGQPWANHQASLDSCFLMKTIRSHVIKGCGAPTECHLSSKEKRLAPLACLHICPDGRAWRRRAPTPAHMSTGSRPATSCAGPAAHRAPLVLCGNTSFRPLNSPPAGQSGRAPFSRGGR